MHLSNSHDASSYIVSPALCCYTTLHARQSKISWLCFGFLIMTFAGFFDRCRLKKPRFPMALFRLFNTSSGYPESLSFPRSSPDSGVVLCGHRGPITAIAGSQHVIAKVEWVQFNGWQWMCRVQCADDCLCRSEVFFQSATNWVFAP